MIKIQVLEDNTGTLVGIRARGHSGSAPAGQDLVCAAVTTVFEMLSEGTRDLPPEARAVDRDPSETRWELRVHPGKLKAEDHKSTRRMLEAARRVLENVAQSHPDHCSLERRSNDSP